MRHRSLSRWFRFLRALTRGPRDRHPTPPSFRPVIESLECREVPSTSTWIGGGMDDYCTGHMPRGSDPSAWSNPLNWLNGRVPAVGDTAVFPNTFVIAQCPNGDGTFRAVNAPFNRSPNLDVSASLAGIQAGPGDLGFLNVNQNLTLTGASEWDSGAITVPANVAFTNTSTATLRMAGGITLTGTLTNQGTMQEASGAQLQLSNATLTNQTGALFDFQGDNNGLTFNDSLPAIFNNNGTLRKSGGTGVSLLNNTTLNNTGGTIDVRTGTLRWSGNNGVSTGGHFTAAAGAVLDYGGAGNIGNTFTGTYTGGGGGVLKQEAGANVAIGSAGATFNFDPGFFQWIGGTTNVAAGATLTNLGMITLAGPIPVSFQSTMVLQGTLVNDGTMRHTGAGPLLLNTATLNNAATGLYDFQTDANFGSNSQNFAAVNNAGIVRKSGGTGLTNFGLNNGFNNNGGTLDVRTGTIQTQSGTSTGGIFTVAAGAVLNLLSGNIGATWTGTYTGSGAGQVQLADGTLSIGSTGATFNFPAGLFQLAGGTLSTGTQGLTNIGTITWTGGTINLGAGGLTNTATHSIILAAPANTFVILSGNGTLTNHGTIAETTAGDLHVGSSATLLNASDGTYAFQGDVGFSGGTFTNVGTLTKAAGTGTSTISGIAFNNSGTINVQTGTIQKNRCSGSAWTGGTILVAAGAVLNLSDDFGTYQGTYTGSGSGAVLISDTFKLSGDAVFNFPSGMLQWNSGTIDVSRGSLTNAGVITIAGPNGVILSGNNGTLTNHGTIIAKAGLNLGSSATLLNASDGTYAFQTDAGITGSGGTFTNVGTLTKAAGTGTSTISGIAFNNSGTINVQTGTIQKNRCSGSAWTGGTILVAAGAVLNLSDDFGTYQGTYTGSGSGAVLISDTFKLSGDAVFNFPSGMLQWNSGTIDVSRGSLTNAGVITIAGPNGVSLNGNGTLTNHGTIIAKAGLNLSHGAAVLNASDGTYVLQSDDGLSNAFGPGFFTNAGTLVKAAGTGTSTIGTDNFSNAGAVVAQSGTLDLRNVAQVSGSALTGGTWEVFDGATLTLNGGANLTTDNATVILDGPHPNFASLTNLNTVGATGSLTIQDGGSFRTAGNFSNQGSLTIDGSSTFTVSGSLTNFANGTLTGGTWFLAGTLVFPNANIVTNDANLIFDGSGPAQILDQNGNNGLANFAVNDVSGSLAVQNGEVFTTPGDFSNTGSLSIDATSTLIVSGNLGNFDPNSGTFSGGTWVIAGTLQFPNANVVTVAANLVLDGSGGLGLILDQFGNNGLANLAVIDAAGVLTLQNGYVLTTGGDLVNFGYLLLDATSQLNVSGNYAQDAAATLEIQLDGLAGTAGQLSVAGAANLDGTLTLTPVNGYVPATGDSFTILTFATRNGTDFANPPAGFDESFDDGNGLLTVIAQ